MVELVLGAGRLAQGRARHRPDDGAVRAPPVRRRALRGDAGDQAALRPAATCSTRASCSPTTPTRTCATSRSRRPVEPEVDRCVECGYCEPVCPSRDLTTTPRQRIVLRREMRGAEAAGDAALARASSRTTTATTAVDTCAVDGMCQTACPVLINTGDLVKRLRAGDGRPVASAGWAAAARHWAGATRAAAVALDVAAVLPHAVVAGPTTLGREGGRRRTSCPRGRRSCPAAGPRRTGPAPDAPDAVFFAVLHRHDVRARAATARVRDRRVRRALQAGGVALTWPDGLPSLCCGTPWKSKGMRRGLRGDDEPGAARAVGGHAARASCPSSCDASSCTEGLRQMLETAAEPLRRDPRGGRGGVHGGDAAAPADRHRAAARRSRCTPPARPRGWGSTDTLRRVAEAVADAVTVPAQLGLLRVRRRPRAAAPRAHGVGHRARRPRRSRAGPVRRATPRATAPASWA